MFFQTNLQVETSTSFDILPCSRRLLVAAANLLEIPQGDKSYSEDEEFSSCLRGLSPEIDAFIEHKLSMVVGSAYTHSSAFSGSVELSRVNTTEELGSVVTSFSESLPLEKIIRESVTSRLKAKRKARRNATDDASVLKATDNTSMHKAIDDKSVCKAAMDDTASVMSSFSESTPLEKISFDMDDRASSPQLKPDSQNWASTEFAAVMNARAGLNTKCSTQNVAEPPNLLTLLNFQDEWQFSEEVVSSSSISAPPKLYPSQLPPTKKETFAMKGLTDPIRSQSFHIDGTTRNHLMSNEEVGDRVPILEILSQRHILHKKQLVMEEINNSILRFGNASVLLMNTHPTHIFISGIASDLHNIGKQLCKGFTIPSFGMFTVKSVDIFLYTLEEINKLVNESLEESRDVPTGIVSNHSELESIPSPLDSITHQLPIYQMKSQDPFPEHITSDSPIFLSGPRPSPMSSASSANLTLEHASSETKPSLNLKSFFINAPQEKYPLLQTYHCLNHNSEHLLRMLPALFFITKLSTEEISLVDLASILVATKPNLEGGFSMELIQNPDDTKTAIIYTTRECEPFLRGIYGDTDTTLWFDVERDTLAKLFGNYPQWWIDYRTTEHESTEYFVQHYYSSSSHQFTPTPL